MTMTVALIYLASMKILPFPIFIQPNLAAQRTRFYGELVPNAAMAGFFQTDINGNPKGIIVIDPTTVL